jgi:hypothetical protein
VVFFWALRPFELGNESNPSSGTNPGSGFRFEILFPIVGAAVEAAVGEAVGAAVEAAVEAAVGAAVGAAVEAAVGAAVEAAVGAVEGVNSLLEPGREPLTLRSNTYLFRLLI